jgi:hypothetical protein
VDKSNKYQQILNGEPGEVCSVLGENMFSKSATLFLAQIVQDLFLHYESQGWKGEALLQVARAIQRGEVTPLAYGMKKPPSVSRAISAERHCCERLPHHQ